MVSGERIIEVEITLWWSCKYVLHQWVAVSRYHTEKAVGSQLVDYRNHYISSAVERVVLVTYPRSCSEVICFLKRFRVCIHL